MQWLLLAENLTIQGTLKKSYILRNTWLFISVTNVQKAGDKWMRRASIVRPEQVQCILLVSFAAING